MRICLGVGLWLTVQRTSAIKFRLSKDCSFFGLIYFFRSRVTAACADDQCKYVAVGTCTGEVAVLNFSSGGLLYTLPHQEKEVTQLRFLSGKCK